MASIKACKTGSLILGTAAFGQAYGVFVQEKAVGAEEVEALIKLARSSGFNGIDTADNYGNSLNNLEAVSLPDIRIYHKINVTNQSSNVLVANARDVCMRLGVEVLEAVSIHNTDFIYLNDSAVFSTFSNLLNIKNLGFAKKIGISLYLPEDITRINNLGIDFDIIQIPLCPGDGRWAYAIEVAKARGIEVHARSVLLQGVLANKEVTVSERLSDIEVLRKKWFAYCDEYQVDPVSAAVQNVLSVDGIDKVVLGLVSEMQFNSLIKGLEKVVPHSFEGALTSVQLDVRTWNTKTS